MGFNSLDAFLNHGKRSGDKLTGWKKNGFLNFVMSTVQLPTAVWSHPFPALSTKEDKDTRRVEKSWYMRDHVCFETEDVLNDRFFRDRESGIREKPPCLCSFCIMQEIVYQSIRSGDVDMLDELFKFTGSTDPKNDILIRTGGFIGEYKSKKLTPDQIAKMNAVGIYQKDAWKSSCMPRCKYLVTLLDLDNQSKGLQVIDETSAVGEAIKVAITAAITAFGGDKERGNPFRNPYAMKLSYSESESDPKKKYSATRIEFMPGGVPVVMTPEILQIIRGPAPSLARFVQPFSAATLRATMEKHVSPEFEMDWDAIFKPAQEMQKKQGDQQQHQAAPAPAPSTPALLTDPRGSVTAPQPAPQAASPAAAPAEDACPTCGKMCAMELTKCPHCGTEFADDQMPF